MISRNIQFSKDKAGSSGRKRNPMEEGISTIVKLKTGDVAERIAAANWLGKTGGKRAVEALIKTMEDDEPMVREAAVKAIVSVGDKSATPAMIEALEDTTGIAIGAMIALGRFGDESAIPALEELYGDPVMAVQIYAKLAAGSIKNKSLEFREEKFTLDMLKRVRVLAGVDGKKAQDGAFMTIANRVKMEDMD